MTVAKVQTPDLDAAVSAAGDQYLRVGRDVHTQHWQAVAVQRQEELAIRAFR